MRTRVTCKPAPFLLLSHWRNVAWVMRPGRQQTGGDHRETFRLGDRLIGLELFQCDEPHHMVILARRLQILTNDQEIDVGRGWGVYELQDFVKLFTEASKIPDFVNMIGSSSLTRCRSRTEWIYAQR